MTTVSSTEQHKEEIIPTKTIKVSIVVEWENILLAEADRCRRMLEQVNKQAIELADKIARGNSSGIVRQIEMPIELLVLYDELEVDVTDINTMLAEAVTAETSQLAARAYGTKDLHYYDLKNAGVKEADGDIIAFLDSDIIPCDQWLEIIIGAFENPDVELIGGNVVIDADDVVAKAFRLGWFFNYRTGVRGEKIKEGRIFFANNVAFRRHVIEEHPFPVLDGAMRGSCARLSRMLRDSGVKIYRHDGLYVSHPPPTNGFSHFLKRGLAQGRDTYFVGKTLEPTPSLLTLRTCWRVVKTGFAGLGRIITKRKHAGLSIAEVPVALIIMGTYYTLFFLGVILTRLAPGYMKTAIRI